MDPNSGKLYRDDELDVLPPEIRERLVRIEGRQEDVEKVSRATAHFAAVTSSDKSRRRAANKVARKSRRHNR